MPTFKQLEAFAILSDAGSISAAARRLGIAQSAASRHVAEFEALFAMPLLDRTGRRARLTVDGAEVLMRSRTVLARRDAMLFALSTNELPLRRLRLGVTELIALTWLNAFLPALKAQFPKLDIELKVEVSVLLRRELRAGGLDAIIVPELNQRVGLLAGRVGAVENQWYCSPSIHPGRKSPHAGDLTGFDLLSQGSLARSGVPLQEWLAEKGIVPRSVISSNSLLAVLDLMASGMGIAHLPRVLVQDLLADGKIRELNLRPKSPAVNYSLLMREDDGSQLHKRLLRIALAACDFTQSSEARLGSLQKQAPRGAKQ